MGNFRRTKQLCIYLMSYVTQHMDSSRRVQRIHINLGTEAGNSHILLENCYERKESCNRRNEPHTLKRFDPRVAGLKFFSRGRIRWGGGGGGEAVKEDFAFLIGLDDWVARLSYNTNKRQLLFLKSCSRYFKFLLAVTFIVNYCSIAILQLSCSHQRRTTPPALPLDWRGRRI